MFKADIVIIPDELPERFDIELDYVPKPKDLFSHSLNGPIFEVVYVCRHISTAKEKLDFTVYVKSHKESDLYKLNLFD